MIANVMAGVWKAMDYMHQSPKDAGAVVHKEAWESLDPKVFDLAWQNELAALPPTPAITPEGLLAPRGRFGRMWRFEPGVFDQLGWATTEERSFQAVVQELRGEKIDIVHWIPDQAEFVCRAITGQSPTDYQNHLPAG